MIRLFRFKRHTEETWVDNQTGTCNMARKVWIQMDVSFFFWKNAEVCDGPWDGSVMKNRMLWLTPSKKSTSGEVRDGGTTYKQEWWNEIRTTTQDGSISGDGTIVEMCGIRWPRNGLAKKTGWKQEKGKEHWRRSTSSSRSFLAEWNYPLNMERKSEGIEKMIKDKTPRDLGPADTVVHTRSEGPTE